MHEIDVKNIKKDGAKNMLKNQMIGIALCLGIIIGEGTIVGNEVVQAEKMAVNTNITVSSYKCTDPRNDHFYIVEGYMAPYKSREDHPAFKELYWEWETGEMHFEILINGITVYLAGYSNREIMNMLNLKKGDKVQLWVTGEGGILESSPARFEGTIFKLKNMTNGKILEAKCIH